MNLYTVIHEHREGVSAWPVYAETMPTEEQITTQFDCEWELDRDDEWLHIEGPHINIPKVKQ